MVRRRCLEVLLASLALSLIVGTALAAPSYSPWGPATSLESLPGSSSEVNTPFLDGCPILSRDGLHLYLASDRPGGLGGIDIWVAERDSAGSGFGAPVNLGAPINSAYNDFCPSPLRDGRSFMFVSTRPGGCGGADIYMTRYQPEFGWAEPVNLGCDVNSPADEAGPVMVFAEPGPPAVYFSSTRSGSGDLYMSQTDGAGSFGAAVPVSGVNSPYAEGQPFVSQDGRELVFFSNRPGGLGGNDIWSATRQSIVEPWSEPSNLGPKVNSAANETRPSMSWDGSVLLFGTTRPGVEGVSDIFYATRN